jgi:hypothetical protein
MKTPAASKTTQYPTAVDASEPSCCPEAHKVAPSPNCSIEAAYERAFEGLAGGKGGGDRDRSVFVDTEVAPSEDVCGVIGNGEREFHGEMGVGVGCVCNSDPGSRKEKN